MYLNREEEYSKGKCFAIKLVGVPLFSPWTLWHGQVWLGLQERVCGGCCIWHDLPLGHHFFAPLFYISVRARTNDCLTLSRAPGAFAFTAIAVARWIR
ncbi:hypothetical protein QQF64_022510 [Cirrhinus molitorella]|uniref:Uncharacterized protein n=1 Tax=Cirrhinus molitorella TaxID=172907 RepID=A0ABR3L5V7_9TELE